MLWETGTSTIRSSPYSIFSVKVMCSPLLKLVSVWDWPPSCQTTTSPPPRTNTYIVFYHLT